MLVSLDGGKSFHEAKEGVRVIINTDELPGEDSMGELMFNFTHEGLIKDLWTQNDELLGTSCEMYEDIIERLIENKS